MALAVILVVSATLPTAFGQNIAGKYPLPTKTKASVKVSTDKASYARGENVLITVSVKPVQKSSIVISIYDPQKLYTEVKKFPSYKDGKATHTFTLPKTGVAGTWKVSAVYMKVKGETTFSVLKAAVPSPIKPPVVTKTSVTVSTDKSSYSLGDSVVISASVSPVQTGEQIVISIYDPTKLYTQVQKFPGKDGKATHTFTLPKTGVAGTWKVEAKYFSTQAQASFSVLKAAVPSPIKPPVVTKTSIQVATDKTSYDLGEKLLITVSVKPVQKSSIVISIYDPQKLYTEVKKFPSYKDGRATHTFTLPEKGLIGTWKVSAVYMKVKGETTFSVKSKDVKPTPIPDPTPTSAKVTSDKTSYTLGEKVLITVSVKPVQKDTPVVITIWDPEKIYRSTERFPGNNGEVTYSFFLPNEGITSTWKINVRYDDSEALTTFSVEAKVNPDEPVDEEPYSPVEEEPGGSDSQTCVEPPTGLLAWWPGDGNANDIVSGFHGNILGDVHFAPGKVGSAFTGFSRDGYVRIADSPELRLINHPYTLENWVYFESVQNDAPLTASKWTSFQGLLVRDSGLIQGWVMEFSDDPESLSPEATRLIQPTNQELPLKQWVHVAQVFDPSTRDMSIFLNGVQVPNFYGIRDGGEFIIPIGSHKNVLIGRLTEGTGENWASSALFDEVSIFDRALSNQEIHDIYNAGRDGKCKSRFIDEEPTTFDYLHRLTLERRSFEIPYSINNGEVTGMRIDEQLSSVIVSINPYGSGWLKISLPRELIDARVDSTDTGFVVMVDGSAVEKYLEESDRSSRTLTVNFSSNSKEVEIIGTELLPEVVLGVDLQVLGKQVRNIVTVRVRSMDGSLDPVDRIVLSADGGTIKAAKGIGKDKWTTDPLTAPSRPTDTSSGESVTFYAPPDFLSTSKTGQTDKTYFLLSISREPKFSWEAFDESGNLLDTGSFTPFSFKSR